MIALKIMGYADGSQCPLTGQYVRACDFDAGEGRGNVVTTTRQDRALMFGSFKDAFGYWQTVSRRYPLRPDGMPNRPLSAYHMEVVKCPLLMATS
jgi:hypothetical protein